MMNPDSHAAAQQRGESAKQLSILAVTSHRPAEITHSLSGIRSEAEIVTIDATAGRRRRAVESYRQTKRGIEQANPDVILLDCYEIPGTVVTYLSARYDVPLVARLVGDMWRDYRTPTLRSVDSGDDLLRFGRNQLCAFLNDVVLRNAEGYVAVSNELRETIQNQTGCSPERVGVVPVPMTVDTKEEGSPNRARELLGVDEQRVVLTVTNLKFEEKSRGVERILSELEPLLEDDPDLAYVVAGGGRYLSRVRDAIAAIDDPAVRERIYAPGYVDGVASLYTLANVFAYVSYRDGYPNAVLEAQTAGLPVVANDAHGMRDQITDGETGYLVDPANRGELGSRLAALLDSPAKRQRIGRRARQRVRNENTAEAVSQQLEAFLTDVLTR
jgi:glycosyltransferase involved in cell wall biosynthesis